MNWYSLLVTLSVFPPCPPWLILIGKRVAIGDYGSSRCDGRKADGNRSSKRVSMTSPSRLAVYTVQRAANSAITWRHMPHGGHGVRLSVTTMTAVTAGDFSATTALPIATRSAQIVAP